MKCQKNTESKNPKVARTKDGKIMFLSKCTVCDSKKSKFFKQLEASRLLSSLGIKTALSKIVNKLLLAGDKSMPEIHLRQPGFTYSACGQFTKKTNKENKSLKKQEIHDIFISTN